MSNNAENNLFKYFNGEKVPVQCKDECLNYALNYKPTQLDRILITYPKCGTYWVFQLMLMIINNENNDYINKFTFHKLWFEFHGEDILKNIEEIKMKFNTTLSLYWTHFNYNQLNYDRNSKYIMVLRNPKDVCVSAFHFHKLCVKNGYEFKQFFNHWISGDNQSGDYFQYIKHFWTHYKNENNFTFLLYEEMKRDIKPCIESIAKFLGEKHINRLTDNPKLIDVILEKTSFDKMQQGKEQIHLRKGVVGDWRSHMTKNESDLIDKRVAEEWMGTGLELLWKEEMKWIE